MNKTQITGIVAILLAIIAVLAYSNSKKVDNQSDISVAVKTEYMNGCAKDGQYAYCNCTYNSLQKSLGDYGMMQMGVRYNKDGELPKEAYAAITECVSKYNN